MQADDVLRTAGDGSDGVHIQGRGVAGQYRARFAHLIKGAEHLLLDRKAFEYGLDDQVAVGDVGIIQGASEQGHALV
ncbi:hypothetical protein D3C87_1783930 [compost metagenome]